MYSAAMAPSLDEECLTDDPSPACLEYGEKLDQLAELIKKQKPFVEQMKGLASEMKQMKLAEASTTKKTAAKDSPELRAAVKEAKETAEKYGATSPEARVAWDNVEEIAAAGNANAMGGTLIDECLVEASEACDALDELNKVLTLKDKRLSE